MSVEKVRKYLSQFGLQDRLLVFSVSSATVELASKALGAEPARIAKSISFHDRNGGCLIIVTAGDTKIDNAKFKAEFGYKAKMLEQGAVEAQTGYPVGGVCPFDNPPRAKTYCDISLRRFDRIFPAGGSADSCVRLSCEELFAVSKSEKWVDVCKNWEDSKSHENAVQTVGGA